MSVVSNIRAIGEKADHIRQRTADSLESAADTVRDAGNHSAEAIAGFTGEAGRRLDSTAAMVRNTCTVRNKMFGGMLNVVRRNPVRSIAVATAVGLVAGYSCRAATR